MKSIIEVGNIEVVFTHSTVVVYEWKDGKGKVPVFTNEEKGLAEHKMKVLEASFYLPLASGEFIRFGFTPHQLRAMVNEIDRIQALPVEPMELDY